MARATCSICATRRMHLDRAEGKLDVIARSTCDEAIHDRAGGGIDCFAALAMTSYPIINATRPIALRSISSRIALA